MRFCLVILLFGFALFSQAQTQADLKSPKKSPPVLQTTQWPIYEMPFNGHSGYAWPSLNQSLQLSSSFYQTVHTLSDRSLQEQEMPRWGRHLIISGFDLISFYLPLGSAWLHEEWHRAVMTHRGVASQNDVYKMQLFKGTIAVSHVDDEDLIRLKRDFPSDQVRLSEAGMEAQLEQNLYLEKSQFFDRSPSFDLVVLWSNAINVWGYVHLCTDPSSTRQTLDMNLEDGSDMSRRDFTGLDCLAWVYDLFRPDEPYQSRGQHPAGNGINRYRTLDQLTEEEKKFLQRQDSLSLLNLMDPFLINFREFYTHFHGEPLVWNAKLQHYLTSFGYDVAAVAFWKFRERNYLLTAHHYFNNKRFFPGLNLELYKWPLAYKTLMTGSLSIWEQPKDQRVNEEAGAIGAALDLTAYYQASEEFQPYIYAGLKDRGWLAGHVELGRGALVGVGLAMIF